MARLLLITVGVGAALALAAPAYAQDPGADVWGRSGCTNCHGNLADGGGDPAYPAGPSLRKTKLEADVIRETISCGRPGTPMPFHLEGAYTKVSCYGFAGDVPEKTAKGTQLTEQQIKSLVDFLVANVVGQARVNKKYCAAFNEGNQNAPECLQYPQ